MRTVDLTTGSIPAHLFRLSTPAVWSILAAVSMQLVDLYFIAQLGPIYLTAISFTLPVTMGLFHVLLGFTIATSSVAARLIGAGETHALRLFIAHALMLSLFSSIFLVGFTYALINPIFTAMGAGPQEMEIIHTYMGIVLWGSVFITPALVGNAAIRAGGDAFAPAALMIAAAVLNAALAWALVFGHAGFPALGVAGAAIATVIADFVAMILSFYLLAVRKGMVDRAHFGVNGLRASARRLFIIALPVGITNLIQPLSTAITTALLATSGAAAVAAFGIVGRIEAMAYLVLMALAIGMGPVIGQNFGARRFDRVHETLTAGISFAVLWSFAVAAILMVSSAGVARHFTTDPHTIRIVAAYFILMGASGALANVVGGWASAWNAMGKPQIAVVLIVISSLVGQIAAAIIGFHFGGWQGMFMAFAVKNLALGLALHLWSARLWHKIKASG